MVAVKPLKMTKTDKLERAMRAVPLEALRELMERRERERDEYSREALELLEEMDYDEIEEQLHAVVKQRSRNSFALANKTRGPRNGVFKPKRAASVGVARAVARVKTWGKVEDEAETESGAYYDDEPDYDERTSNLAIIGRLAENLSRNPEESHLCMRLDFHPRRVHHKTKLLTLRPFYETYTAMSRWGEEDIRDAFKERLFVTTVWFKAVGKDNGNGGGTSGRAHCFKMTDVRKAMRIVYRRDLDIAEIDE